MTSSTLLQIERIRHRDEEENTKWAIWRSLNDLEQRGLNSPDHGRKLRLLSLDGGGIRGITSLMILDQLMGALAGPNGAEMLPCDYFDLIGGTSTGGLIAIMLGRLRMSVKDCIHAFQELGEHVFDRSIWKMGSCLLGAHRFPADRLENAIKQTVWAFSETHSPDAPMQDQRGNACKTFVVAVPGCNVDAPVKRFRTYDNPSLSQSADTCTIWEAGRATACAPSFFPEIQIPPDDGIVYADGALGYNNPVQLVLSEARSIWGDDCDIGCLVSIGTAPLIQLATDCEHVHQDMLQEYGHRGFYHRFNVPLKNEVALHEWKKMEELKKMAWEYVAENYDKILECAERLAFPRGR